MSREGREQHLPSHAMSDIVGTEEAVSFSL